MRIAFTNFWKNYIACKDFLYKFIEYNFGKHEIVNSNEEPDILISSCFGSIKNCIKNPARKKIFFCAEDIFRYPEYKIDNVPKNLFDIEIHSCGTERYNEKYMYLPHWITYYPYYTYTSKKNVATFS